MRFKTKIIYTIKRKVQKAKQTKAENTTDTTKLSRAVSENLNPIHEASELLSLSRVGKPFYFLLKSTPAIIEIWRNVLEDEVVPCGPNCP